MITGRELASADIVHSIAEEDVNRIFDQWVKLLKAVVPGWEWSNGKEYGRIFYIGGKLPNGKKINLKPGIFCPANNFKQVYQYIDSK